MKKTSFLTTLVLLLQLAQPALAALTEPDKALIQPKNWLVNPGAESGLAGITASTPAHLVTTTAAGTVDEGNASFRWQPTAAGETATFGFIGLTSGSGLAHQNVTVSCRFKSANGITSHTVQGWDGTNKYNAAFVSPNTSDFVRTSTIFATSTSGNITLQLTSGAADTLDFDKCYVGLAEGFNLSQVSQASIFGTITYPGTSGCVWTSAASTSYGNFPAQTSCPTPTVTGAFDTTAGKIPGGHITSMPPGDYYLITNGSFTNNAASNSALFRFSDGTNSTNGTQFFTSSGTGASQTFSGHLTYTTTQSNVTIQIQGAATSGTAGIAANGTTAPQGLEILVYYFPSQSQTALSVNQQLLPTVQTFTSGSGTYTRPNGVSWIKIRAVGGGGGGGATGTTGSPTAGAAGTATSFGPSLIIANGGAGGSVGNGGGSGFGGTGGTASIGTGAVGTAFQGQPGGSSNVINSGQGQPGPAGGATFFSGAGNTAGGGATGNPATANTGSGGSGGGGITSSAGGGGGGSGGYVDALIVSPASTYPYVVGSGGTGGAVGGGNGAAGGSGGAGYIEVTEFYGTTPYPLLIGSVTTNSSGLERINSASISNNGTTCSVVSQSGNWVSSISHPSTGACALTIPSLEYSNTSRCVVSPAGNGGTNAGWPCEISAGATSTSVSVSCSNPTVANHDQDFNIICPGPH